MPLTPLAPVSALEERLGVPVGSLVDEDLTRATRALEDASHLVRVESGVLWVDSLGTPIAPEAVVVVVLQIAKRTYINPDGLSSESVEGYSWQTDQQTMGIYLSEDELRTVRAATAAWRSTQDGPARWGGTGSLTIRPAYVPGSGGLGRFMPPGWRAL
jgi:hypothetical protein